MNKRQFIITALAAITAAICISCSKKNEKPRRIVVDPPEEEKMLDVAELGGR